MYPNLIRVEEHNRFITFSAFATDSTLVLDGWESLKETAYHVDYRRGVKKCAEQLSLVVDAERLSAVNTTQQAVQKLLAGRIDIFVGVDALMIRTPPTWSLAPTIPSKVILPVPAFSPRLLPPSTEETNLMFPLPTTNGWMKE